MSHLEVVQPILVCVYELREWCIINFRCLVDANFTTDFNILLSVTEWLSNIYLNTQCHKGLNGVLTRILNGLLTAVSILGCYRVVYSRDGFLLYSRCYTGEHIC